MGSIIRRRIFSLPKQPKDLDPSYKTDLDFLDCFRRQTSHLIAYLYKTDLDIRGHSRDG